MSKFNEKQYLKNYPDVADAIRGGAFKNGMEHFEKHGKAEGRTSEPVYVTKRSTLAAHDQMPDWIVKNFNLKGMDVLEIGARKVCYDETYREKLNNCASYTGFDVIKGPNVDVVGDAHKLSSYFPMKRFDLIFSFAVFEHLAMPWVVSYEIAKLLKPNGFTVHETHFSFSEHELPWHFFQFNSNGLEVLFCKEMGFQTIDSGLDNPIDGVFSSSASSYLAGKKVAHLYCHSEIISQMTNKEALKSFEWSKVAKRLHEQSMYPTKSGEKWLPK